MVGAGVRTICISPMNTTNSPGEPYSAYPNIRRYDRCYDFDLLDRQFRDLLKHCPDAQFIVLADLNSPLWLARRQSLDSFCDVSTCALRDEGKQQVTGYLNAFLEQCEARRAARIAGYHLACGRTGEWIEMENIDETVCRASDEFLNASPEKSPEPSRFTSPASHHASGISMRTP